MTERAPVYGPIPAAVYGVIDAGAGSVLVSPLTSSAAVPTSARKAPALEVTVYGRTG